MITVFYIVFTILMAKSPVTAKSFDMAVLSLTVIADMFLSFYLCISFAVISNKRTENKINVLEQLKTINKKTTREQHGADDRPDKDSTGQKR